VADRLVDFVKDLAIPATGLGTPGTPPRLQRGDSLLGLHPGNDPGARRGGAILARLPDGYFTLKVRAAVSPDDEPATVLESTQNISVKNGKWKEMDDVAWRKNSRVSLATFDAQSVPKGGVQ